MLTNANARTGRRRDECSDIRVLGAYGCDTLNDNRQRLLGFAGDNKLSVGHTFFSTPMDGASHTFQRANNGKERQRLDYIAVGQAGLRLVRNVSVHRVDFKASDRNFVYAVVEATTAADAPPSASNV